MEGLHQAACAVPAALRVSADLTKLERSEQVAEWVRLTDEKRKGAQLAPPGGRQANDVGIKAASRELGIERTDYRLPISCALAQRWIDKERPA